MFGSETASADNLHLDPRAIGTLDMVIDLLEQGQAAGLIRKRPSAARPPPDGAGARAPMLTLDGPCPEKVG